MNLRTTFQVPPRQNAGKTATADEPRLMQMPRYVPHHLSSRDVALLPRGICDDVLFRRSGQEERGWSIDGARCDGCTVCRVFDRNKQEMGLELAWVTARVKRRESIGLGKTGHCYDRAAAASSVSRLIASRRESIC